MEQYSSITKSNILANKFCSPFEKILKVNGSALPFEQ
jgi:hypothetical protein